MSTLDKDKTLFLLSNFTHQVINPLNGVAGTLDNLLDGTISKENIDQRIRSARGQLECTISLVRNLAFFGEYTAQYGKQKKEKMDKVCVIPQLLIESAQFYQEQARLAAININVIDRHRQFAVKGNPDLLRQVFMNLIDNGVKYGIPGSTLEAKYWLNSGNSDLIVVLSGPSVGFKANEDIFALGVRGKAAEARTSSGSGLGLHICKLIIENVFDGAIKAEFSPQSSVTTFTIRISGGFENV